MVAVEYVGDDGHRRWLVCKPVTVDFDPTETAAGEIRIWPRVG